MQLHDVQSFSHIAVASFRHDASVAGPYWTARCWGILISPELSEFTQSSVEVSGVQPVVHKCLASISCIKWGWCDWLQCAAELLSRIWNVLDDAIRIGSGWKCSVSEGVGGSQSNTTTHTYIIIWQLRIVKYVFLINPKKAWISDRQIVEWTFWVQVIFFVDTVYRSQVRE